MINAGFGSAGERCMAISAAVAVGPIADDLVAKISERATTLKKTGDGTKDSDMGPLVTKAHRDKVASYIDAGESEAPRSSSTAGRCLPMAAGTASGSVRPCWTTSPPRR